MLLRRAGAWPMRDTGSGASEQPPFWAALRPCTRTHPLCLAAEALRYASEGFRNNRDLVIEAVQENAEALLYAADSFQNDRDLVKDAVEAKAEALLYAAESFQSDESFILEAVKAKAEALQPGEREPAQWLLLQRLTCGLGFSSSLENVSLHSGFFFSASHVDWASTRAWRT